MHATAELVRSVLRWSLAVVQVEESRGGSIPGPRLSQFMLGNLLTRTDRATCVAIAREIVEIEKSDADDQYLEALVACIRASWGNNTPTRVRRTGKEDTVMHASSMVTALRRFSVGSDRDLLEVCSVAKTWRQTEGVFRGRDWSSIRDDFERLAKTFYLKESMTVCATAEYIMRIATKTSS